MEKVEQSQVLENEEIYLFKLKYYIAQKFLDIYPDAQVSGNMEIELLQMNDFSNENKCKVD